MQFIYPNFLWALLAVLAPIIIHLFTFRRYKTVYFSNVQFLQNIRKESKSRSKLKNLLLLLARILALVFLVLAFARPYIPVSNNQIRVKQSSVVGVYVDNSFSMEAKGKYGILLESAKMKAHAIANAYNYNTQFLLSTNNFELKHQQLINKDQFVEWVSQIKSTHIIRSIYEVQERQNQLFEKVDTTSSIYQYLLSDFQKTIFNTADYPKNKYINYTLVPFENKKVSNVYIDSVWFDSPGHFIGKNEILHARIVNYSQQEIIDWQINLFVNDSLKALSNISILENSSSNITLPFVQSKIGINLARIELSDYPITFDNTLYFSFSIDKKIKVLTLNNNSANNYFKALFKDDNNFTFTSTKLRNIDYEVLKRNQVVILNGLTELSSGLITVLKSFIASGKRLVLIPAKDADVSKYQQLLNELGGPRLYPWKIEKGKMQGLNLEHQYFKEAIKKTNGNMRLPDYEGYFPLRFSTKSNAQILLETESGSALVVQESYEKGSLIILALPLDDEYTNLATHPLFVPLFYNAVLYSSKFDQLYYFLKPSIIAETKSNNSNGLFQLVDKFSKQEIIPRTNYANGKLKVFVNENELEAGYQKLISEKDTIAAFSFNYDRKESEMESYSEKELEDYIEASPVNNINLISSVNKNMQQKIKQQNQGKSISVLFLWLVLFMLVSEIAIIKLLR